MRLIKEISIANIGPYKEKPMKQRRTIILSREEAFKILTKVVESKLDGAKVKDVGEDENDPSVFVLELEEEDL